MGPTTNPVVYGWILHPVMFVDLATTTDIAGHQESSGQPSSTPRTLFNALRNRLQFVRWRRLFDPEAILLGATGWVVRLVNAFPH